MIVQELIEMLEGISPDAEVRFASQPSWPFEYSIDQVIAVNPNEEDDRVAPETIYLVEGRQIGYLPHEIKDEIGW
jgi:hypothetical protein